MTPAELTVPRTNAVVIIDFGKVDLAEQARLEHRMDRLELRREAHLEADARLDRGATECSRHDFEIRGVEGQRLLDDHMLAGLDRFDELGGVILREGANGDGIDVGIGQHGVQVLEHADR